MSEAEFNELCTLIEAYENEPVIKAKMKGELQNSPFASLSQDRLDRLLTMVLGNEVVEDNLRQMYPELNWPCWSGLLWMAVLLRMKIRWPF